MISLVGRHLLESTAFASVVCVIALCLRKRNATGRYAIWLIAAAKFAIPAAAFSAVGAYVQGLFPLTRSVAVISANLSKLLPTPGVTPTSTVGFGGFWLLVGLIWFSGSVVMLLDWFGRLPGFLGSSAEVLGPERESLLRMKERLGHRSAVRLQLSDSNFEPVLSGIWRPTIAIPNGLSAKLSLTELDAVMLHELAHAKRWDNLTGALVHGIVRAFWFHPLL